MNYNIEGNKQTIKGLLSAINRPGVDKLISFLESSDYFNAPASTKFHGEEPGGLAEHSLNVFKALEKLCRDYELNILGESIVIAGILHDVCKINIYEKENKWVKDENNKWQQVPQWVVKDKLPLGHGEKSVAIILKYIPLTDDEMVAIRWHSGMTEAGTHFSYPTGFAFKQAFNEYPLSPALHIADMIASYMVEPRNLSTKHT